MTVVEQETSDYPEGTIISQSRGTDTVVVKGVTLKIIVAKKREEVVEDIPDESTTNEEQTNEEEAN